MPDRVQAAELAGRLLRPLGHRWRHTEAVAARAEERGLADQLVAWQREDGPVTDALWAADMTTGPRGELVEYPERLREILGRYGEDSIVGRTMLRARPMIEAAVGRTEERCRAGT